MTATLDARSLAAVREPRGVEGDRLHAQPAAEPPRRRRWAGAGIAAGLAAFSGWAFSAGIAVPWPWSDEGATYLALQRSYPQLLVLYRGPDAPLVPYYLLAKAWTDTLHWLWPLLPTLVAVRLLSAAAACSTVVALYALVSRNVGRIAGLLSGVLLVSLPGFDRLAQEARPYTLLALAATASWLLWDRWLRPARRLGFWPDEQDAAPGPATPLAIPSGIGYLASVVGLGLIHTFGLFQWPAQLVAGAVARPGRAHTRPRAVLATAAVLSLGAVLVAVQTWASLTHGTGSQSPHAARVVSAATAPTQVARGIFLTPGGLVVIPVLGLVVVAVVHRRVRAFALTMLVWLVVPLAMELALSAFRTNLFRSRYWVADLPPLAAAAGVGLAVLAQAVYRLASGARAARPARASRRRAAAALAVVTVGMALAVQGVAQAHEQAHLRSPRGHHSETLSGVLSVIDQTTRVHPHVPVLISSGAATGILGAARPPLLAENPLRVLDPRVPTVYTVPASQAAVRSRVRHSHVLLWIFRGSLTATSAAGRIPHGLAGLHMRVRWAVVEGGGRWTAILLQPRASIGTTATPHR